MLGVSPNPNLAVVPDLTVVPSGTGTGTGTVELRKRITRGTRRTRETRETREINVQHI